MKVQSNAEQFIQAMVFMAGESNCEQFRYQVNSITDPKLYILYLILRFESHNSTQNIIP